jgi:hypothetical protein
MAIFILTTDATDVFVGTSWRFLPSPDIPVILSATVCPIILGSHVALSSLLDTGPHDHLCCVPSDLRRKSLSPQPSPSYLSLYNDRPRHSTLQLDDDGKLHVLDGDDKKIKTVN